MKQDLSTEKNRRFLALSIAFALFYVRPVNCWRLQKILASIYYIPRLNSLLRETYKSCVSCLLSQAPTAQKGRKITVSDSVPTRELNVDLLHLPPAQGWNYALVACDVASSYVRYGKCYFQDLKNSRASLFSHHIAAEGCKNKGFRHFLAKKSISNCLAWMKTRCSIPSSFCSLFFILFFILSHLGSDYMVIFFCLAQSHVKMLQFKPNRRLLAQFVEQIY